MKRPKGRGAVFFLGFFFFAVFVAQASDPARDREISQALERFHVNPQKSLTSIPRKWDSSGRPLSKNEGKFSIERVRDLSFVDVKAASRRSWVGENVLSEPGRRDRPEALVDRLELRSLAAIEKKNLLAAQLPSQPWSDTYWPIYLGGLAQRYADEEFPHYGGWKKIEEYLRQPVLSSSLDSLSPAEKYDLLVGDEGFSLRQAMVGNASYYFDQRGEIESWMGYCHGWAAASFMLPRPSRKILVPAANGQTMIPFYPSDMKGLATLLWAEGISRSRFVGGRCDDKNPRRDENGRVISEDCLDTNPATWHLAVVNQIGVSKRSFVMDATFDYQVWNQPVIGYRYSYFNPMTRTPVERLSQARTALSQWLADPFKKHRSNAAESVVGIAMEVTYLSENSPTHSETDDPSRDSLVTVRYMYDLELDSSGEIVGGEWYEGGHPDFLWVPPVGERAKAYGDYDIAEGEGQKEWSADLPIPGEWRRAAVSSSARATPLAHIVEPLLTRARLGF